jgi:hypothetical protein
MYGKIVEYKVISGESELAPEITESDLKTKFS